MGMAVEYKPLDLLNKITQNNYSYSSTYKKKITQVDEDVEKLQGNMSTFKKSMKWLKKYTTGASSKTRLEKEVKSLIKSYNEMDKNKGAITDKEIRKQLDKLDKLFTENKKNLKKIGIEKVNGKYTIDSKEFDDADEKALSALFEGSDSFINKADKIMRKAEAGAEAVRYSRVERKITNSMDYKESDILVATFMPLAQQTADALNGYSAAVKSGNLSADYKNAIKTALDLFAKSAYKSYSADDSGYLDKMNQLCRDNMDKLNKLGIDYSDADKKTIAYTDTADMDSEEFKAAYDSLFGKDGGFGTMIQQYAGKVFNSIIKPDKIGVSIIDMSI